ncbi:hypothetical protein SPONN_846 [uncultured Candidatus Thioglobus sp.]|nr:hypothetical protein SPONN_1407 [uncultured Candidatus Thioglobus sp.]SMM99667.1 hypothetical protein SPONN_846 [uncultured Candidatus Thioglobus sp.]
MGRNKVKLDGCNGIEFYIDEENKDGIIAFLNEKGKDKLQIILSRICNGKPPKNVYSSENYTGSIKNITAIKFKGKAFNNARIYCKDYNESELRIIVLSELLASKKQTKLTHKEKNLIKKVNDYDY